MQKKKVKIYLVKREVRATSIKDAMTKPGKIYEIVETSNEPYPEEKNNIGFKSKKKDD